MTRSLARLAMVAIATCALISCSPQNDESAEEGATAVPGPAAADMFEIALSPLTEADIAAADLPDELACAFSEGGNTLLFAKSFVGDAERGEGIVRIEGDVVRLATPYEGGFGAMEQRGEFTAEGIEIDIEQTSANLAEHEGSAYDAILTVRRSDGSNRAIQGEWSCGP
ncbi:MAG TPA: hypothetical protein VGA34_04190 [Alteraurantiacibacter sp.]